MRSALRRSAGSVIWRFIYLLIGLQVFFVAACGGGWQTGGATLYSIGGTVSGLTGQGLVLQNNGGNNTPVSSSGSFALSAPVTANSSYNVTILTQPSNPTQVCTVSNGSGKATANVTSIQISCALTAYTIGGAVAGLSGHGLVLQDNGGDNLAINASGPFTFFQPVAQGKSFNVTILTQPSNPTQICAVSNGSGTANANYTGVFVGCSERIGGTVSGLTGSGLVLQDNGADNLPISSDGAFTFATAVNVNNPYLVSVLTQPASPAQACIVLNGTGIGNGVNVTNIQVNCNSAWTWEGGPSTPNQSGAYGSLGVPALSNNPGARRDAATWIDAAGNFWLYGGTGFDVNGTQNDLSDLWEYSAGEWTWVGGANTVREPVSYGTQGVAAPGNTPGARRGAGFWTDAAGNFWLFGGIGRFTDNNTCTLASPCSGEFNDLWEYSAGMWKWVSGPNVPFDTGTYGTQGVPSPANVPPPRALGSTWVDAAGDFWLYGGFSGLGGPAGTNPLGVFGDLWKYSAGEWTWVGGSNSVNQPPTFGTLGVAAAGNSPGARDAASVWLDSSGNVWLFGGDLWKYSGGEWAWMGGPSQLGVYGTLGVPAPGNIPGARTANLSWVDSSGNFWIFGGDGEGAVVDFSQSLGDVWKYSGGQWTWMGGSNAVFQPAVYESIGLPGDPGGREGAAFWIDKLGNVWVFGGADQGTTGHPGYLLSDIWMYK